MFPMPGLFRTEGGPYLIALPGSAGTPIELETTVTNGNNAILYFTPANSWYIEESEITVNPGQIVVTKYEEAANTPGGSPNWTRISQALVCDWFTPLYPSPRNDKTFYWHVVETKIPGPPDFSQGAQGGLNYTPALAGFVPYRWPSTFPTFPWEGGIWDEAHCIIRKYGSLDTRYVTGDANGYGGGAGTAGGLTRWRSAKTAAFETVIGDGYFNLLCTVN